MPDGSALYVNLYGATTLNWTAQGVIVTQSTDYPREQGSTITVERGGGTFEMRLRVPSWATAGSGDRQRQRGERDAGRRELLHDPVPHLA